MESLQEQIDAILNKSKLNINGITQGDLNPDEYLEKVKDTPSILGYTMSVLRTDPMISEWYYSDRDRYDSHVLIDSIVNGLDGILSFKKSLDDHIKEYPFFARAYQKYLDTPDRDTRHLLQYLYLYC